MDTFWFPTKTVSRSRGTNYYIMLRIVPRADACCLLQKNVSNRTLEFGFLTFIGLFEKNVSNGTFGPVLIERNSDQWKQCLCLGFEEKHLIHTFNLSSSKCGNPPITSILPGSFQQECHQPLNPTVHHPFFLLLSGSCKMQSLPTVHHPFLLLLFRKCTLCKRRCEDWVNCNNKPCIFKNNLKVTVVFRITLKTTT